MSKYFYQDRSYITLYMYYVYMKRICPETGNKAKLKAHLDTNSMAYCSECEATMAILPQDATYMFKKHTIPQD